MMSRGRIPALHLKPVPKAQMGLQYADYSDNLGSVLINTGLLFLLEQRSKLH